MGPAPVINTSSPATGKVSAVCTAFPNGSKIAPSSASTASECTHTLLAGITTYSANAPFRLTPTPEVFLHMWRRPARQLRQVPQMMWPSPETRAPNSSEVTSEPISTMRPENSCPIMSGAFTAEAAHASQDSMCKSVPQMPVFSTRILTSVGPGVGSAHSIISRPGAADGLNSARIVELA